MGGVKGIRRLLLDLISARELNLCSSVYTWGGERGGSEEDESGK